jgi:hypothetical protein
LKQPYEMSFTEFAENVKPSGAVNRTAPVAGVDDYLSYTVYLNGPLASGFPPDIQEQTFKDVMVHALTKDLGLNHQSFRDNLKVVELVTVREAWMASVLALTPELSKTLSEEVLNDFETLNAGLMHPWVLAELNKQRAMTKGLKPALDAAALKVGADVKDKTPNQFTNGIVLSSNSDFTVQAANNGEIVTHENRRLVAIPEVGQNISVAYYRGAGQVFESHENIKVTDPYLDKETGALAVMLLNENGAPKQVLLFSGLSPYDQFIKAQNLDKGLLDIAFEVLDKKPKVEIPKPIIKRELLSDIYVDDISGCLAVDYSENGAKFSVVFSNAEAIEAYAKDYGFKESNLSLARKLESGHNEITIDDVFTSLEDIKNKLAAEGASEYVKPDVESRRYVGRVAGESSLHVAQDIGRKVMIIHDKRHLDKLPEVGDRMTIEYKDGRGTVTEMERQSDRGVNR